MTTTALDLQHPLSFYVRGYNDCLANIREGRECLARAEEIAKTIGNGYIGCCKYEPSAHDEERIVRRTFWTGLINLSGVRDVMGPKAIRDLDTFLNSNQLPAFTEESIALHLAHLRSEIPNQFAGYCREVFEMLRPGRWNEYKTNLKNRVKISNKVIWAGAFSYQRISSHTESLLSALDNLCHIFDKKPIVHDYQGRLPSLINRAIIDHQDTLETEYFKFKMYSQTLHIQFKRMDLIEDLNRRGADGNLIA